MSDFEPPAEGPQPGSWEQGPPAQPQPPARPSQGPPPQAPPPWQQGPPPQGAPPRQQGPPPQGAQPYLTPYGPGHGYTYPEASQATTAIIVSIIGIMFCQLLSPIGWVMGKREMDAIDAGRRDPTNRTEAKVAYVLGIIGTVLIALGLVALAGFVLVLFAAAAS